ncbi:MAG: protein-export chaperone SecB [Candidatus Marithrix sp.]|nr:protein-export chaperone SecB [Candidatus Marithrix sp.]
MAEKPDTQQNAEQFVIQNIYVKDVSFETPNSPQIFMEQWKPKLELEISNDIKQLNDELFEVVLNLTSTVKVEEKTAFLVEIHQAGLFIIKGFPNDRMSHMLNAYCPNVLFPFARENVANLVIKGGFQPLWLSPINFDALYAQQLQKQNQQPSTDTIN